jgi:hypothetical protein
MNELDEDVDQDDVLGDLLEGLNRCTGSSIVHKTVLIRISRLYHKGMSPEELYETTRGVWRINVARAKRSELVMAVVNQRVLEVYRPHSWLPAGSTAYQFRDRQCLRRKGRWEFVGELAEDEIRQQYFELPLNNLLPFGAQNPIRYVNI